MEATQSQSPQLKDPHDVALIARVEEELSSLKLGGAPRPSEPPPRIVPDFSPLQPAPPAGTASPQAPAVDTTFRPISAADDVKLIAPVTAERPAPASRSKRSVKSVLIALLLGIASTVVWQTYGDGAWQKLAARAPQPVIAWIERWLPNSLWPTETAAVSQPAGPAPVQPAVADASPAPAVAAPTDAAPAAVAAPAPAALPATAALPADVTQLLQSMAQELATARQEIAQLKAGQDQMARDVAKMAEAKLAEQRRVLPPPPRPVAAPPPRRPVAMLPPPLGAPQPRPVASRPVTTLPPPVAAAPSSAPPPPVASTQATPPPPGEPQLAAAPRPPLPVQ